MGDHIPRHEDPSESLIIIHWETGVVTCPLPTPMALLDVIPLLAGDWRVHSRVKPIFVDSEFLDSLRVPSSY